ncbi:MAG: hypothetical protein ACQEXV_25205 [Bacillota bacterium]
MATNEQNENGLAESKTTIKNYRVKPEIRKAVERQYADSEFETEGDFLEYLSQLHEMQQLKSGVASGYRKLLNEREYHRRRDEEIFLTMIQSEAAARLELTQNHEAVLAERNNAFLAQEQTITELNLGIKQIKEERDALTKERVEYEQLIAQLRENQKKGDMLVEEYREKIDTLSGLVNQYQAAAQENKQLGEQVLALEKMEDKQANQIAKLESDIAALKQQKEEELKQQEARLDIQKERELLKLQGDYQAKIEQLSAEMRKASEESTAEIRKLLNDLNNLRESKTEGAKSTAKSTTNRRSAAGKGEGKGE